MTTEIVTQESAPPWNDIDAAFDEVRHHLFDTFGFRPALRAVATGPSPLRAARTDIEETPTHYRAILEVPGIAKENLSVTVRDTTVEVRAEFASAKDDSGPNYVYRERGHAGFFRSLELPQPVVADKAVAKVENGLLTLELPKQHVAPEPAEVKVPVQ